MKFYLKSHTLQISLFLFSIVILGMLPHVLFSLEFGDLLFFKAGFDEDTYVIRSLDIFSRLDRLLSTLFLYCSVEIFGSINMTMIFSDFALPLLASSAAFALTRHFTDCIQTRVFYSFLLLFGQEFMSTGNNILWGSEQSLWNCFLASDSNLFSSIVPYYFTSYFSLFRTPEPQIAWSVAFWGLKIFEDLRKGEYKNIDLKAFELIAFSFALPLTYIFVSFPIMLASISYGLVQLFSSRKIALYYALPSTIYVVVNLFYYYFNSNPTMTTGVIFHSRTPILSMSVLYSALSLFVILGLFLFKKVQLSIGHRLLGLQLMTIPIVLMNQQVITGIMVSTRDYEVNVNYILLLSGLFLFLKVNTSSLNIFKQALVIVLVGVLFNYQFKTYQAWNSHNQQAQIVAQLLSDSKIPEGSEILLLEDIQVAPLIESRLKKKLFIYLDFNDIQGNPINNLQSETSVPHGRSFYSKKVFSYFKLRGFSRDQVLTLLKEELSETRGQYFLAFFFGIRDFWPPHSDNRMTKRAWIKAQLEPIANSYNEFDAHESLKDKTDLFILSRKKFNFDFTSQVDKLSEKETELYLYKVN